MLLRDSDPGLFPAREQPLKVTLGLDLAAIRQVDTTRDEVEIMAMRTIGWKNPFITLEDKAKHKGPISVDIKHIWTPDIVAYNPVHAPESLSPPLAVVNPDGETFYIPNERIRFTCNLEKFETDEGSNCTLRYGSWTRTGDKIGLIGNDVTTDSFQKNPRIELLNTYTEVQVKYYPCCSESYPSVVFTLNIRKRNALRSLFSW